MMRQKIASYSMTNLPPAVIAGYRDDRPKTFSAGTIIPVTPDHTNKSRFADSVRASDRIKFETVVGNN